MVLAAPLLTRLYTPEDFGLLAVYSGLLAMFTVVASLRYELAIPLPQCNTEAANVLVLSILAVLMMTAISTTMVLLVGQRMAYMLNTPSLVKLMWLLPVGVFLSGIYNVFNYWAVRTKAFSDIARTRISQALATLAIQLFGYKIGGVALLLGQASGQGVGSIRLGRSAIKHKDFSTWSWSGVWVVAKRYKHFPIFSTWSGLLNSSGSQLPPLIFSAMFGSWVVGLYALASRILKLPMTVLGGAIGKVYFSNMAQAKANGTLAAHVEKGAVVLLELSLPAALVFMLFSPAFFSWVFGEDWKVAGEISRWMVPWILFQFLSSPLSVVYFVLEKERLGLFFQAVMFSLRAAAILLGYMYFDFMGALMLFSLTSAACYFFYSLSIFHISGASYFFILKNLWSEFLRVFISLVPVAIVLSWNEYVAMIIAAIVLLGFYFPRVKRLYSLKDG
nr:oligosaccharide flippase family protein [Halomonas fontilapidosi]